MATKNPCARTVKPEQAYEVWQVQNHPEYGGTWTWYVLKKYQSPEKEVNNPFARWYCMVQSPATPQGEYGDVYVSTVKAGTRRIDNPLAPPKEKAPNETLDPGA